MEGFDVGGGKDLPLENKNGRGLREKWERTSISSFLIEIMGG